MGAAYLLLATFFSCLLALTVGLQCYKCGEYNDGVGSITPCINYTHMKLIECPSRDHTDCIKYISEGSVVRDCVANCHEKETWGSKTLCCNEPGCNSAPITQHAHHQLALTCSTLAVFVPTLLMMVMDH